jgi:hypothetical protein
MEKNRLPRMTFSTPNPPISTTAPPNASSTFDHRAAVHAPEHLLGARHVRLAHRRLRDPMPAGFAAFGDQLVNAVERGGVATCAELGAHSPGVDRGAGADQVRDPPLAEAAAGDDPRLAHSGLVEQPPCLH